MRDKSRLSDAELDRRILQVLASSPSGRRVGRISSDLEAPRETVAARLVKLRVLNKVEVDAGTKSWRLRAPAEG